MGTTYSTPQVAKLLGAAPNSIRTWATQWVKDGLLTPVAVTPGGHLRFTQEQFDKIKTFLNGTASISSTAESGGQHAD